MSEGPIKIAASGPASVPVNRFYIGDCLPVLADMAAAYGEFADLVYLDPPFNSQRLYNHAFRGKKRTMPQKVAFHDSWKWTDAAKKDFREFTEKESPGTLAAQFLAAMRALLENRDESTLAYLTYMTRRLARVRVVMKPAASIYLHCDPTASHYLKLAMDAVFGRDNFRNEIVWKKYSGRKNNAQRKFATQNDCLLFYAKSPSAKFSRVFIPLSEKEIEKKYRHVDDAGRRYRLAWGRNYQLKGEQRRIYLVNEEGKERGAAIGNLWVEDGLQLNTSSKERLGYMTQKPVALLRRIIASSSNEGDLVLDPFCGCGTTLAASHEMGRRFIGIDVARSAAQVIARRMQTHYPGFGKLMIGDKTPTNVRGWGRLLPREDDESPAWARFQYAAIDAIPKAEQIEGAIQRTAKLGADGGIDGRLYIRRPQTGVIDSIVIQVKRKRRPSVADVADTILAADNNNAFMGLLITLHPPTREMLGRAAAESTKRLGGKHYPKVAILTYEEVKAGKFHEALPYEFAVDLEGGIQAGLELADN